MIFSARRDGIHVARTPIASDDQDRHDERRPGRIEEAAAAAAGPRHARQRERGADAAEDAERDEAQAVRGDEPHQIPAARADRDAHRQLLRSPRDREREHAVDAGGRQQQAGRDERRERRRADEHLLSADGDDLIEREGVGDDGARRGLPNLSAQREDHGGRIARRPDQELHPLRSRSVCPGSGR